VLRREFTALIPAFDHQPGRTNVNQTSDLEVIDPPVDENDKIPDVFTENSSAINNQTSLPRIKLTLKGPFAQEKDIKLNFKIVKYLFMIKFTD